MWIGANTNFETTIWIIESPLMSWERPYTHKAPANAGASFICLNHAKAPAN